MAELFLFFQSNIYDKPRPLSKATTYLNVAASLGVEGRNVVKMTQKNITINRYIRPHPLVQLAADTDDTLAPEPTATHVQFENV